MCVVIRTVRGWVCHTDLTGVLVFLSGDWGILILWNTSHLSAIVTSPAGCGMTTFAVVALYCDLFVGISFPHTYLCTVVSSTTVVLGMTCPGCVIEFLTFVASVWVAFEWLRLVFSQVF